MAFRHARASAGGRSPASAIRANSIVAVPSSRRPIATIRPEMRGRMMPSRSPSDVPVGRPTTCAVTCSRLALMCLTGPRRVLARRTLLVG